MLKPLAACAVAILLLVLSYRPMERGAPEEMVPGLSVTITCHPDEFMSAENNAMFDEALKFSGVVFVRGFCPIVAPIEIVGSEYRPVTFSGGSYYAKGLIIDVVSGPATVSDLFLYSDLEQLAIAMRE